MRIAFYAGNSIPIHSGSLDERPLGGTETGLIRVSAELSKRGHEVTVFTAHTSPPQSIPRYLPAKMIYNSGPFDIIVLIQEWKGVFFNLPAPRLWVWTGDGAEQFSNYGMGDKRVIEMVDKLLLVSEHHKKTLCGASGFPEEKVSVIGNGVHAPYYEGEEPRSKSRLIFTSAPYRGLHLMPKILLNIRNKFPDLQFHCFSGMNLYDREQPFEGPHVAHYRKVAALLQKIPGVVLHGNVTQNVLAREYMKSGLFVYPNVVPETCCITAMEAQAAGCALVTSALGALPETVGDTGIVVPEDPGSDVFLKSFTESTMKILSNDKLWKMFSEKGRKRIKKEGRWSHVVDRIEALF